MFFETLIAAKLLLFAKFGIVVRTGEFGLSDRGSCNRCGGDYASNNFDISPIRAGLAATENPLGERRGRRFASRTTAVWTPGSKFIARGNGRPRSISPLPRW